MTTSGVPKRKMTASESKPAPKKPLNKPQVPKKDSEKIKDAVGVSSKKAKATSVPKKKQTKSLTPAEKEKKAAAFKKKNEAKRLDEIEKFLARVDNPDEWRTLRNPDGSEKLVLTDQELSLITRLCQNQTGTAEYNPFEPAVHFFSRYVEPMALPAPTEPKRRFIPSIHEAREIKRLVRAIKAGTRQIPGYKPPTKPRYYDIWGADDDLTMKRDNHIAAPRVKLPLHSESYNPPAEYLFNGAEEAAWRERQAHPDIDEPFNPDDFLPQKHGALRLVPGYSRAVYERYARCLDLFLCPRAIKNKLNINPDSLLPQLPDPRDLRPFPLNKSINYATESTAPITGLSFDSTGLFFASAQDLTVSVWEVQGGRCLASWTFEDQVTSLAWNPNHHVPIVAVTHGSYVTLLAPSKAAFPGCSIARELLSRGGSGEKTSELVWTARSESEVRVALPGPAKQVVWHRKGDYFATVTLPGSSSNSPARSVMIHHLSKQASQQPFRRLPSAPIHVAFHPSKPAIMLVSPAGAVRIYNLQTGELEKKLQPDSSCALSATLSIHPSGDHVLMAGSDGRVTWFDLDLASRPYQTLSGHTGAVRCVTFHPRLPLFASASTDGSVQISHGQVFQDFLQNPIIVPVKIITGHSNKTEASNRTALTHCTFHPSQPWILTGTVDGSISLFTA